MASSLDPQPIAAPLLVEVAAVGIVPVVGLFVRRGNFDIGSFLEHRRSERQEQCVCFGRVVRVVKVEA